MRLSKLSLPVVLIASFVTGLAIISRHEVLLGVAIVLFLGFFLLLFAFGGGPGRPPERRVEYTASTWEGR